MWLSIRLCAAPTHREMPEKEGGLPATGFTASLRGLVAGHRVDCGSPAFWFGVAAAVGVACAPQPLLCRALVPRRPAALGKNRIQWIGWRHKRRGPEKSAGHSVLKWFAHAQDQIYAHRWNLQIVGGAEQRDSICLSSSTRLSSPTWSSG